MVYDKLIQIYIILSVQFLTDLHISTKLNFAKSYDRKKKNR